ncbi:hypothetical protein OBP_264 [Pseudomonas phage OBP]|uniref:hypothetical protein n=1 Tax=Pseudomonas phage OBP TaxID=1124849 RepID=UPI000240D5F1|nr:hypothetical protein OBP_264 [Pseudomonas phage OBP]AEV89701.1 hypothetical protein OBP_264 [Pseudomonas phage OBP]
MSEKQKMSDIQNQANLIKLAQFLRLDVLDNEVMVIEHQEWRDRYKVSLAGNIWYVKTQAVPHFWLALEKGDYNSIGELSEGKDELVKFRHAPSIQLIDRNFDQTGPLSELMGEDFINIDRRMSGLVNAGAANIRDIAKMINTEMDLVNKDTDVVKDFDGILTFNTPVGKDFKLELCFDKVKPVDEGNEKIEIQRTPITKEDQDTYLRGTGKKVVDRLNEVTKLVQSLLNTPKVQSNPELLDYAVRAVEVTLTMAFLNQTITYISFGGVDDWRPQGETTPNNEVCMKILDDEVEHLIKFLDDIPKQEGVDVYSIDMDTFAIFGRNNDNRVVTPALQGYTGDILKRYSRGFERLLAIRMGLSDNAHFFKA